MTAIDAGTPGLPTRIENATYVIDQFRQLDLKPHPNCRLMQMHRVLKRGSVEWGDAEFCIALETERDMRDLAFIFKQMEDHRDTPKFRKLVASLLRDSALPQDDLALSPGRDTQFELFVAAICQNAGLLPVDLQEPDVNCTIEGKRFAIAAKRLKSMENLRKHIRKAALQIKAMNRPGVIVLDLSMAWNRANMPIASQIYHQLLPDIMVQRGWKLLNRLEERIQRWVAGKGVLAILTFDFSILQRANRTWGLHGNTYWLKTAHADPAIQDYKCFYNAFLRGVPGLTEFERE